MKPGATIAHYEIVDLIGAGGMGEVFRATDKKLSRDVALKVLPPAFAEDANRLARFQREAQALAALQHANIASIYGIERDEGQTFLVMELCEGEDLSTIIERGALSIDEARSIAGQIASGLEEAHEKGVIHRDLKPANIKVSSEGKVKLLDFGLARTFDEGNSSTEISADTMTAAIAITQPGVVLGTAAYMSPEQARGKSIDKRTDIWAFGVILHEMLTGERLFSGETVSDVLASVLRQEITFENLPPDLPVEMSYLIRRSLDRHKESRLRDIGEARCLFNDDASASSLSLLAEANPEIATGPSIANRFMWPLATVLALCALLFSIFWPNSDVHDGTPHPTKFTQLTAQGQRENHGAVGPEGNFFVFAAKSGDYSDIFMQRTAGSHPINLTKLNTSYDSQPTLSADGQKIVFTSNREGGGIYVMGATGESVRLLARDASYPAWSPDGLQVAYSTEYFGDPLSRSTDGEIWIVSVDGGPATQVPIDIDAVQPAWSPNGKRIAFWSVLGESGQRDLWTVRPDGTGLIQVTNDEPLDYCPVWSPDGRWLYFLSNRGGLINLWRLQIDESSGEPLAEPERVTVPSPNVTHFSISPNGSQILYTAKRNLRHLYKADFDPSTFQLSSRPTALVKGSMNIVDFSLSNDGEWVSFLRRGLNEDLYIIGTDGSGLRQVTDDIHKDRGPSWYDDDQKLIFYSDRSGKYDIWSIRPDGAGLTQLSDQPESYWYPLVHPAVNFVAALNASGTVKLPWNQDRTALGDPLPLTTPDPNGLLFYAGAWSPDGRQLLGRSGVGLGRPKNRVAIYDLESDSFEIIFENNRIRRSPVWGPRGETILAVNNEGLQLMNLKDGSQHTVLSDDEFPDVIRLRFNAKNNLLVFLVGQTESDLWMMELAAE